VNRLFRNEAIVQARTVVPESANTYAKWDGNLHLLSRYHQHLRICGTCRSAHRRFSVGSVASLIVSVVSVLIALRCSHEYPTTGVVSASIGVLLLAVAWTCRRWTLVLTGRIF
jgi:hypothetical protein